MSDDVRDLVLAHALTEIPTTGFSDATLTAAGAHAGVEPRALKQTFPNGPESLMEAFSHWADQRMTETMQADTSEKMRERVRHAVKARIEVLIPHKAAARRAAAYLALPQHAVLAARLMMGSVDAMWRAAGDKASDFSYYTKRATLSGVYGSTLLYWLGDSGPGIDTWAFLDKRIDNVMSIEKFRQAAREAVAKFPNPFAFPKNPRGRN